MHVEQLFMIEVFAGCAMLTSVAKSLGLGGIAIDKLRKAGARSTIYQLDLLQQKDRKLLWEWLHSPLLLYVHFAPVCGTASKAREIPRAGVPNLPKPLRSLEFPLGLPMLSNSEQLRVSLANDLFDITCDMFEFCVARGILASIENPRGSYFWCLPKVLALLKRYSLYAADFQACMFGSERDKWTRIMASFQQIEQMSVSCNRKHVHKGWGFTIGADGQKTWATSVESQYPRQLCLALLTIVLQLAHSYGVILKPDSLADILQHPLESARNAKIAVGVQPRGNKLPPIVPNFQQAGTFFARGPEDIPCALMGKLDHDIILRSEANVEVTIPKCARLLRAGWV